MGNIRPILAAWAGFEGLVDRSLRANGAWSSRRQRRESKLVFCHHFPFCEIMFALPEGNGQCFQSIVVEEWRVCVLAALGEPIRLALADEILRGSWKGWDLF